MKTIVVAATLLTATGIANAQHHATNMARDLMLATSIVRSRR